MKPLTLFWLRCAGLDLVRRDWCTLSREVGRQVIEVLLSGKERDEVCASRCFAVPHLPMPRIPQIVEEIHTLLGDLSQRIRDNKIPLAQYIITKGLNKSPQDYPDARSQPHLQVALAMMRNGKAVNVGDHIPFVIANQRRDEWEASLVAKESKTDDAKPLSKGPSGGSPGKGKNGIAAHGALLLVTA